MVAVPEVPASDPVLAAAGRPVVPVHRRRVVAVAVSPMELLRPASDLVRLIEGFSRVDLLVASEHVPTGTPGSLGVLDRDDPQTGTGDDPDDDEDDEHDELRDGVAQLGLPGLYLHRLGLRAPLGPRVEDDLVAALSELVGFDPEPGVYCLAPAPAASAPSGADPGRAVVDRAAQRIAQVYGLPLLRYRCLELAVVGEGTPP